MKTTYEVNKKEEDEDFIILLNGGFTINPQNIAKMESIKEKIKSYFNKDCIKTTTKDSKIKKEEKIDDRLN